LRILPYLQLLLSQDEAGLLIRRTARQQWRLIALNLVTSLVQAGTEGVTLAVVFLAVEVLSAPGGNFNWATSPLVGWWPAAVAWLNGQPLTAVVLFLLALAVLLQALQSLSKYLSLVTVAHFAARCQALVTARIHSQVLSFSFPCASSYRVGDLTDYAGRGPMTLTTQIDLISSLAVNLLMGATYLVVLVGISPWLLLAVLVMGTMIMLLQKRLLPRIKAGSVAVTRIQVDVSSRITEDFQGLRLLHTSGQLDAADQRLRSRMAELERQLRNQGRRLAVVQPFSSFLPILAIALIAALSLLMLEGSSMGVLPSLVTFVLALQRLNMRLNQLAANSNELAKNSGGLERLNQILTPEDKQFRRQGGTPFQALENAIRFERVGLQYSPEKAPSLRDISFSMLKGQTLALVGPSGAGKSSIADLLTGLYAPTAGQIWIDGTPLEKLELGGWQQRLGVVSQDTFLFNASIAENIAFGTAGVSLVQIKAACQAAQAAGFIESLPDGYDSLVGERGYRLSGGQRQRLSLARAILRDPELLILDEATSALDTQSERLVQEAIERFERSHTVLVIAHRLSTIAKADLICVLESGRITERGTHSELLNLDKTYACLWNSQLKLV
jgi:ATP-binding cassette subfamily B protein/subfamily B ATP-binding cassette protein MsbA